jgi:hypothetical protein
VETPDRVSGRYGLKLSVGAILEKNIFFSHPAVTLTAFSLIERFCAQFLSAELADKGAEKIVLDLQEEVVDLDVKIKGLATLLEWFEGEFCLTAYERPGLKRSISFLRRYRLLLSEPRLKPIRNIEEVAIYWRYIDSWLAATRQS